jgi:hypothetical protein
LERRRACGSFTTSLTWNNFIIAGCCTRYRSAKRAKEREWKSVICEVPSDGTDGT